MTFDRNDEDVVVSDWHCADADGQGFVSWDLLRRQAGQLEREAFLSAYPAAGLLVMFRDQLFDDQDAGQRDEGSVQLLTVSVKSAGILRYLNRLAFVCKRPGNPYAHLVSIGRSVNNDISLTVDSLSKVHGYFVADDGSWQFTDHGSTNGSRLNGEVLEASAKVRLNDGDILQLGLEVMLEYLLPTTLYQRLTADG